jgi:hypothetical protein
VKKQGERPIARIRLASNAHVKFPTHSTVACSLDSFFELDQTRELEIKSHVLEKDGTDIEALQ